MVIRGGKNPIDCFNLNLLYLCAAISNRMFSGKTFFSLIAKSHFPNNLPDVSGFLLTLYTHRKFIYTKGVFKVPYNLITDSMNLISCFSQHCNKVKLITHLSLHIFFFLQDNILLSQCASSLVADYRGSSEMHPHECIYSDLASHFQDNLQQLL